MRKLDPLMGEEFSTISFEEWIRRIFDRSIDDKWWVKEETDWNCVALTVAVDYLTRLFDQCDRLLASYTDAQADQGLWFVAGPGGDNARHLLDLNVPWPQRFAGVRSTICLYKWLAGRCSDC